jgi:hypothetical protein
MWANSSDSFYIKLNVGPLVLYRNGHRGKKKNAGTDRQVAGWKAAKAGCSRADGRPRIASSVTPGAFRPQPGGQWRKLVFKPEHGRR